MNRRHWLGIAAAAGLAAVGGGVALRRSHDTAGTDAHADAALWASSFDRLDGTRLDMSTLRGRPLIVNFWATWCAPCVREMPLLDKFQTDQAAAGWQVLGIAADKDAQVREFIDRLSIRLPIVMAGASGLALSRQLGNDMGGLPFTVVADHEGTIRVRKAGEVHAEDLAAWAARWGRPPSA